MPEQQTEAHQLIEHLMIAANEAVAGLLEDRGLPAVYRVHENPEGASVQRLVAQLESLDVPTPPVAETLSRHPGRRGGRSDLARRRRARPGDRPRRAAG